MSMRVLRRYMLISILKIAFVTAILASLILMGVDLFSHLDSYMNHNVSFSKALAITVLYFPEAFLLAIGPSFLFAVSYQLSSMHSSNEILIVLDSGVSVSRLVLPVLIMGLLVCACHFAFSELVAIPLSSRKTAQTEVLTMASSGGDNRDIALSDMQSHYMVFAGIYSDYDQTLYDVSLVQNDASGRLVRRTDAYRAQYDQHTGLWEFFDVYEYTPEGESVSVVHKDSETNSVMSLEPQLFRNLSNEISSMSLPLAKAYLARMKSLNPQEYASLATEYYQRILGCLTPLVMIVIACSITYRFKKNVLFFSLVGSICIAVVYFVVRMLTVMLADQGVIAPILGTLIPFAAILVISSVLRAFLARQ